MNFSNGNTAAFGRYLTLVLTAALLAACSASPPGAGSRAASDRAPAAGPGGDAPAAGTAEAQSGSTPRNSVDRRASPEAVTADPDQLIGMDRSDLTALLGKPLFVRDDTPAQLWRYRNKICVLHLFLYRGDEAADSGLKVQHYETRGLSSPDTSPQACLGALLNGPHTPTAD